MLTLTRPPRGPVVSWKHISADAIRESSEASTEPHQYSSNAAVMSRSELTDKGYEFVRTLISTTPTTLMLTLTPVTARTHE